jgi:UDP-2-acetamido-3-amino-2,3-dideoxy-glucuronate N-acetyltransferase
MTNVAQRLHDDISVASDARIHATAIIEREVTIGRGSSVWDNVHIRHGTTIGEDCIIGEKTYVAYGVNIADRCKINAMVYICTGVTLETGVMISAGTVFTNDRFPRATTPDLLELRSSDPDETTLPTRVREGATIGANATIGSGLIIGRWAMVGMGSIVTRTIPDFHLVIGQPAQTIGFVCRCGQLLSRVHGNRRFTARLTCAHCERRYEVADSAVVEIT